MLEIKQARLINPATGYDQTTNIYVQEGVVSHIGDTAPTDQNINESIDAAGMWLLPGLIDLGGHLPEPGFSQKGTIASESQAAANGGFTHLCSLPDTKPVVDTPAVVQLILEKSQQAGHAKVLPLAALTQGLQGEQLSNMFTLYESGAVGLSNGRQPIRDSYVLRRLMEYASTYSIPLFLTANNASLASSGCMHEGATSTRLGLPGIPETAETIALAEILLLAEQTGAPVHISQLSCQRSVKMLHEARKQGLAVTGDTPLANLLYTDETAIGYKSLFHVQPPLRSEADRQSLIQGVKTGLLAISSNHRPHELAAKKAPFAEAEAGMSQYDHFLPQAMQLVDDGLLTLEELLNATSTLPALALNLEHGIEVGKAFNACLYDPSSAGTIGASDLFSRSHNHPALDTHLKGRVKQTFVQA